MDEDWIPPMPMTTNELLVLARSLKIAFESEDTKEPDKEVITRMRSRIDRFAERQGAFWDKPGN
jgi:hypothetical protein